MIEKVEALYIRVSTDMQYEEGYSVDAQKEMLAAYCKSKGFGKFEYYIDGGFTGSNIERPEMQRLIKDCKDGKINHVVVYKLDRLSRSQKDTLFLIEEVFLPYNVDFISINESFDTSSPFGRAMIGILSVFAQLERENILMRTRMGMKERVKSGLWMGGATTPYGYDYSKELGTLVPNPEKSENVRKMFDLYIKGYSVGRIAETFGILEDCLVRGIIKRKTYTGITTFNGVEYMGNHEPIISLETYNRAMAAMKERSVQKVPASNYLLTGLLHCGKCGAKMRYQKWGTTPADGIKRIKIVCYSQQKSKKYLIKDANCDCEKNWADKIEDAVIQNLFAMSLNLQKDKSFLKEVKKTDVIDLLSHQYDICSTKVKKLYNLYAESNNDILLQTIEENEKVLENIKEQLLKERERNETSNKVINIRKKLTTLSNAWEYMTPAEKQGIVRECIEKVVVTDNNVEVHYKLLQANFDKGISSQ